MAARLTMVEYEQLPYDVRAAFDYWWAKQALPPAVEIVFGEGTAALRMPVSVNGRVRLPLETIWGDFPLSDPPPVEIAPWLVAS